MWLRAWLSTLRGPGKTLFVASAVGWIALAWLTIDRPPHPIDVAGHEHAGVMPTTMFRASGHFAAMWLAMLAAMGPPLLLREVGYLWRTSLRRLRHLTTGWFICGYFAAWIVLGIAVWPSSGWIAAAFHRVAIAVSLVVLWHCSPAHQRCLNACHRVPPMRLFGIAAQWDALRYGIKTGGCCIATCGLLMASMTLTRNHHATAMAIASALTIVERYLPGRQPAWQLPIVPRYAAADLDNQHVMP